MDGVVQTIVYVLAGLVVGLGAGYIFFYRREREEAGAKLQAAELKMKEAEQQSQTLVRAAEIDAKDIVFKAKSAAEKEADQRRAELLSQERKLGQKEDQVDKRGEQVTQREREIDRREQNLVHKEQEVQNQEKRVERVVKETEAKLEEVASLSAEEAKRRLMEQLEAEARKQAAGVIARIEKEAEGEAKERARKVVSLAIQRYAGEFVAESTVSVVDLPSDDMKGRIIGREGRNIRTLENACGIDLIIDDTPEAVVISGFNPVRREVAKMALERLIGDGRIHPARIEELVEKCKKEVEQIAKQAGEQAAFDLGLHGLHQELLRLLGRLRFRYTGAYNQLQHSIEVGTLAGLMAGELGLNVKQARRAGLLHDIGKAADHEMEGSHAQVGAELCKRYGEAPVVVRAVRTHEGEEPIDSVLGVLVDAANRLSNARPGARREQMETYVQRLEQLEAISKSYPGVEQAFAIQCGREVRVVVAQEKVSDDEAVVLCRDITKRIESDLTYAGTVTVTVVRESRAVEIAR
jgi:ribonuclease Y